MIPDVSVIIPTFQRPGPLTACLDALARQDHPGERFEVILVDDGGDLPDAFARRGDLPLTILHQTNAGPAAARNAGAARARGAILAFTDDDCRPAPDWLRRLVEPVRADPSAMVGGRTVNILPEDRYAAASQLLVDYLYEYYSAGRDGPQFFTSNNIAVNAARFRALGGFDTGFPRAAGEDRELCDRWRHAGGTLRYVPAAIVQHAHHLSLRGFWRQHFGYGTGAARFHSSRAGRRQDRVELEPISFYGRLVAYPLRRERLLRAAPLVALMALSQVANAAGYFAERRRVRAGRTR